MSTSDEDLLSPITTQINREEHASENAKPPSQQDTIEAPTDYDRANRYYGPSSTWLSWTRSEREVIRSLDQERAENLSVHLYIAHKIKKHAKKAQHSQTERQKGRATSTENEDKEREEERPFILPKAWTAWPLPPKQVPRVFHTTDILDQDDYLTIKAPQDLSSSAELEECLVATTARIARKIWDRREWMDDEISDLSVSDGCTVRGEVESFQQSAAPPLSQPGQAFSSGSNLFTSQPATAQPSSSPTQSHTARSRPKAEQSPPTRSRSPSPLLPPQASLHPVPLADDERARTLLRPASRHIIAQLNALLMGLHRARHAYAVRDDEFCNGNETLTETDGEMSKSRSRRRKKKRKSRVGKKMSSPRRNSEEDEEEEDRMDTEAQLWNKEMINSSSQGRSPPPTSDTQPEHPSTDRKRRRLQERKLSRLGLRDWSDVLGMAALTGWDREVLSRAGRRCAGLFDEDMGFRTFHAGMGGYHQDQGEGKAWVEETWASGREVVLPGQQEENEANGDTGDEDGSSRRGSSSSSSSSSSSGNHDVTGAQTDTDLAPAALSTKKREDASATATATASADDAVNPNPRPIIITTTNNLSSPSFPCPHPPCHRHHSRPFLTRLHLARHLNQQHRSHDYRPNSSQQPVSSTAATASRDRESPSTTTNPDRARIYCPVTTCNRHVEAAFSRGKLLYQHVRKVHPEMDLQELKASVREKRKRKGQSGLEGGDSKGRLVSTEACSVND